MLLKHDPEVDQTLRRLRHTPDFQQFLAWVEHQRNEIADRCVYTTEEPRLRQFQGAAQVLRELVHAMQTESGR